MPARSAINSIDIGAYEHQETDAAMLLLLDELDLSFFD